MQWLSGIPAGPYGLSLWKGIISRYDLFKGGWPLKWKKSLKVRFWKDVQCGSNPLMCDFPEMFRLASFKEELILDHVVHSQHSIVWNLYLRRPVSNWELEAVSGLLLWLEGTSIGGLEDANIRGWAKNSSSSFLVCTTELTV